MKENKRLTTRRITRIAMLAAVCAVLGYVALDLGNLKVTFESLPILLAAFLFGPLDGLLVGGIGTLVYQLLRYGISITTPLWILPYVLCGLFAGLLYRKKKSRIDSRRILCIVILMEVMILLINTGVIYIDSKVYGYYSFAYVFGSFWLRTVICIVKSIAFGMILPLVMKGLYRANITA